jgi:hypothetical protein
MGENAAACLIALAENYGHKGGGVYPCVQLWGDYLKEQAEIMGAVELEPAKE